MEADISLKPIGWVKTSRTDIQDDYWGDVVSVIALDPEQFGEESVQGLEAFSHLEVIFYFHRVVPEKIDTSARHPRNNLAWPKVGIFAQRAKGRPNQIGLSRCKLLSVNGLEIKVQSLDALDKTPILDIKPYIKEFGPVGKIKQPDWTHELMKNYYQSLAQKSQDDSEAS